ncbi:hypothetical protein [Paludisphaera borealis]|uniref:Uncharacterized protein n=1 Tax=Paludisphaera borealis TaxID=1387353 RepID=A0A1U7CJ63_9BACT|nr:hypothetical protein [Paludisphaera borealis]APW58972.1 hypothetical protein BSF38_00385 [Paludisphaera borealis]
MLNHLAAIVLAPILFLPPQQPDPSPEPAHQRNPVYEVALRDGLKAGGTTVALPAPTFHDGLDDKGRRAALLDLCGSEQAVNDLLRDSVTAPYILKLHDAKTADSIIRSVDLWFVVRADLSQLDPVKLITQADAKAVEVGNMRFEQRLLTADDPKPRNRVAQLEGDAPHWFVHLKGRLLDRIAFEAVDEVMATRTDDSMVIAARVDPAFNPPGEPTNHWKNLAENGPANPFQGGVSYVKVSRLKSKEAADALFVEMHAAFAEPEAWFRGAPILRSKFAPVAQDQVRRLRRELLKNRPKSSPP